MIYGQPAADTIVWGDGALSGGHIIAREQIQSNREFLQKEVSSFLNEKYYTYDDKTCERDVGYIVDAVELDLLLGTNYNSVLRWSSISITDCCFYNY